MSLSMAEIVKLQQDYLYARPEVLADVMMFMDEKTVDEVLAECKVRGIDMVPYVEASQREHDRIWGLLKS